MPSSSAPPSSPTAPYARLCRLPRSLPPGGWSRSRSLRSSPPSSSSKNTFRQHPLTWAHTSFDRLLHHAHLTLSSCWAFTVLRLCILTYCHPRAAAPQCNYLRGRRPTPQLRHRGGYARLL